MNKTLQYRLGLWMLLLVFLGACTNDLAHLEGEISTDQEVRLTFSLDYDAEPHLFRGLPPEKELHLFMFDEDGMFLLHEKHEETEQFHLSINPSKQKRIFHIALVDKGALDAYTSSEQLALYMGKEEGEIINQIESDELMYWTRKELDNLLQDTDLGQIRLLRNQAQVMVVDATLSDAKFELLGYAVHNAPTRGTLAPFDGHNNQFTIGAISEASANQFIGLTGVDAEFVSGAQPISLFERAHSHNKNEFYILVKALFEGDECYYKLGLHDAEGKTQIDVERNYRYVFNIQSVSVKGYATAQEAMKNAPAQSSAISILFDEYAKISNGYSSLQVEKIVWVSHQPNEEFFIEYQYTPDPNLGEVPKIEFAYKEDPGEQVIDLNSFLITEDGHQSTSGKRWGVIKGKTYRVMPKDKTHVGEITIQYGNLKRVIRLEYGPKKKLDMPRIVSYGDNVDDEVVVQFTISHTDIANKALFPMTFYVESKYLYPNTDSGKNSGLSIVNKGNGLYVYKYVAKSTGVHNIHFKRTLSNKSEVLLLSSGYYQDEELLLQSVNGKEIMSVKGAISYRIPTGVYPVPLDTEIQIDPTTMPRAMTLYDHGKYRFQFDKSKLNTQEGVSISAQNKNGASFRGIVQYADLVSNTDIILNSYLIRHEVSAYMEYDGHYYEFDARSGVEVDGPSGISVTYVRLNYETNTLAVEVPSYIPDAETVTIISNYDPRLKCVTRVGLLKKGATLTFEYR